MVVLINILIIINGNNLKNILINNVILILRIKNYNKKI